MESVTVSIKYSNRALPRIYNICGEDFETIKEAVKAAGGRYDGLNYRWTISAAAFKDLKSTFKAEAADIIIKGNRLAFAADGTTIYAPQLRTKSDTPVHDPVRLHDILREARETLQNAYNKSDDAFGDTYEAAGMAIDNIIYIDE
jgi:hypothetical protein